MNKDVFLSFVILSILFLPSCFRVPNVPDMHKKNLSYCYNEKHTGIDSLININGYFKMGITPGGVYGFGSHVYKRDTNYIDFMFFNDGFFLYNIADIYNIGISKYFQQVVENTKQGKEDDFYKSFDWGCYILSGDTIKTQYINHPHIGSPVWMLFEEWFKIIDRNNVKSIFRQMLYGDKRIIYDARIMEENKYVWYNKTYTLFPAKFIPTSVLPSSDCWLKKEKWFWCDEKQYEEWRQKDKEIKKASGAK